VLRPLRFAGLITVLSLACGLDLLDGNVRPARLFVAAVVLVALYPALVVADRKATRWAVRRRTVPAEELTLDFLAGLIERSALTVEVRVGWRTAWRATGRRSGILEVSPTTAADISPWRATNEEHQAARVASARELGRGVHGHRSAELELNTLLIIASLVATSAIAMSTLNALLVIATATSVGLAAGLTNAHLHRQHEFACDTYAARQVGWSVTAYVMGPASHRGVPKFAQMLSDQPTALERRIHLADSFGGHIEIPYRL
jgi:hypothetical protein